MRWELSLAIQPCLPKSPKCLPVCCRLEDQTSHRRFFCWHFELARVVRAAVSNAFLSIFAGFSARPVGGCCWTSWGCLCSQRSTPMYQITDHTAWHDSSHEAPPEGIWILPSTMGATAVWKGNVQNSKLKPLSCQMSENRSECLSLNALCVNNAWKFAWGQKLIWGILFYVQLCFHFLSGMFSLILAWIWK